MQRVRRRSWTVSSGCPSPRSAKRARLATAIIRSGRRLSTRRCRRWLIGAPAAASRARVSPGGSADVRLDRSLLRRRPRRAGHRRRDRARAHLRRGAAVGRRARPDRLAQGRGLRGGGARSFRRSAPARVSAARWRPRPASPRSPAKCAAARTKLHILVNNAGVTWGAPFETFRGRRGSGCIGRQRRRPVHADPRPRAAAVRRRDVERPASVVNIGSVMGR